MTGQEMAERLRKRDVTVAPAVLNLLESDRPADRKQAATLLRDLSPTAVGDEAPGHIIGVTGPPGAGKSTLLSALIAHMRTSGYSSVAALAVDPSSRRSGGSLLGDRARITFDPSDKGVFIRSTAAGERLGGLARGTRAAAQALAAAFEVVIIETVGVGQAETDIADVADTVVVVVQPGGGDVLQFLKSGIMEIPDVLVVTKRDLGVIALRTQRDLATALRSLGNKSTPVLAVSSLPPALEFDRLTQELEQSRMRKDIAAHRLRARRAGALDDFTIEYGQRGLRALGGRKSAERFLATLDPHLSEPELEAELVAQIDHKIPVVHAKDAKA